MSELKTYKMVDEKYCTDCVCVIPSEVYLKSEADKVIAEKDAEIAELKERHKEEVDELQKATDSAWGKVNAMYDEILNHKYKRCLTMAMWCWCVKELNRYGDQDYMDFAEKWRKRWLKLAEKFKEGV